MKDTKKPRSLNGAGLKLSGQARRARRCPGVQDLTGLPAADTIAARPALPAVLASTGGRNGACGHDFRRGRASVQPPGYPSPAGSLLALRWQHGPGCRKVPGTGGRHYYGPARGPASTGKKKPLQARFPARRGWCPSFLLSFACGALCWLPAAVEVSAVAADTIAALVASTAGPGL